MYVILSCVPDDDSNVGIDRLPNKSNLGFNMEILQLGTKLKHYRLRTWQGLILRSTCECLEQVVVI